MKLLGSAIHYLLKMVFDEKLLFFHFSGPDNAKNVDNSKSPKNELLSFAMQQENFPRTIHTRSSHRRRSAKKVFLKTLQISQEKTCIGISF